MKKLSLLSLMLAAAAFAQGDTVVRWRGIEGVITAPGTDNPVSQIHGGAGPWTTRSGSARINLQSGEGSFDGRDWFSTEETPAAPRARSVRLWELWCAMQARRRVLPRL